LGSTSLGLNPHSTVLLHFIILAKISLGEPEAKRMRTSVVAYKVPGVVDFVKNGRTGLLVDNRDVQQLTNVSVRIIQI